MAGALVQPTVKTILTLVASGVYGVAVGFSLSSLKFFRPRKEELKNLELDGETYNVKSFLGKGGFGAVYKYTDSKGKVVAIKKIGNKTAIKEAKILLKVKGSEFEQYFVQLYKILKSSNGVIYIVMEYCDGGSLNYYVEKVKKLDIITAYKFLAHLIKGVQKLHIIGLMHRDLKPHNILMTNANAPEFAEYLTQIGTRCYMAPEILEGLRYDKSADIYSLGGIMYFMQLGIHPVGLSFDECGYPKFIGKPKGYSHKSVTGRMLCKRKEERIKLDEIKFYKDTFYKDTFYFTTTNCCKFCAKNL